MKASAMATATVLTLVMMAITGGAAHGQSPAPTPGKSAGPVEVPIVRLPVAPGVNAPTPGPASGEAPTVQGSDPARTAAFGFQAGGVELRPPAFSSLKTNGPVELKGPVPRLMKPQRRTFGGFVSSFANLFNPMAPLAAGESSAEEYRYDGRVNRSPLPRSFRDERFHEPQALIIGVALDGEPRKVEEKPTTSPKTPVP